MLHSFFLSIPRDLDESAMVDGCTRFEAFKHVIIPVMWPGVITTGLFSFLLAYNDFAITALLLTEENQTMVPKIAALTVFIRFLYVPFLNLIDQWQMILIFLSIASMLFGAIAAIGQTNLKRLVAYSSIGHVGYALAGVAAGTNDGIQSSVIYITIYILMNLGLFSCLLMLKRDNNYYEKIDDLSGLSKNHPMLALSLLIILFSLAGIPPLAGFFAKFYVFKAVIEQSMYFLAIVGLLSTVVAAFYYLRLIKIMYFDEQKEKYDTEHGFWLKFSLTASTVLILIYFIFPSQLVEVVSRINII